MNKEQYESINVMGSVRPMFDVTMLEDPFQDKTLLYGYTVERDTFHVYLKDGLIHRYVYEYGGLAISHGSSTSFYMDYLVPSKRTYPEHSDYEFCALLTANGISPNFTTFTEPTDAQREHRAAFAPYAGCTY